MTKRDKLLERLKDKPKDFTWGELTALMKFLGYTLVKKSGSRRRFINYKTGSKTFIHEPHPQKTLKAYQIDLIYNHLVEQGVIKE
ncbi:MAG: type II toxin-antitoxin system HicA family toxin [Desulfosalsimonas sp.]